MNRSFSHILLRLAFVALACISAARAEQSPVDVWETQLRPHYFPDQKIADGAGIIELKTPYRAEDAAFTPVSITAKIPQTESRYIETLYLIIDQNPEPLAGIFHLTPAMGHADLALRIRVNSYTNVRAIAVTNDGAHYMVANFVKAQGGCSAPLGADMQQAMDNMGKMQFKLLGEEQPDHSMIGQLMMSHPNITGMQKDQRTQLIAPAHYVKSVKITLDGVTVMTAETGISISQDPSFRFFIRPRKGGELKAEMIDSKGREWEHTFTVDG
ncbi:MAG: quinoprotein dehydrogenase-associated SoxYZ-like carrier [Gammaproteobacteria bacterium]|nr:quinoprotein dehydrogenase-associated SoxYZ-like carrier [Gammaproteobacteria bacterium]MBI5618662.1 quinoprotein dehydrogenase-associated SoxYZ-like carrier [Gammaproteobacteria bacterium]